MNRLTNEDSLYALIKKWCPQPDKQVGIGDDAAVVKIGTTQVVTTTDSLVENIHFKSLWVTPTYLGRKAALTNMSDFSAMGAIPRYALISLILPEKYESEKFLKQLYEGLIAEFSRHIIYIVGGNISAGSELSITVTLFGTMHGKPLTRFGGHAGDVIFCTGYLGEPAYELSRLYSGKQKQMKALPPDRLRFSQQLAQQHLATSAIDISDGLSLDLKRLCAAGRVGAKIIEEQLPVSPALLSQKIIYKEREQWVLHGGEIYELLFTAPKTKLAKIRKLAEKTSTPVCVIGELLPSSGKIVIERKNGKTTSLVPQGWDHFRRK